MEQPETQPPFFEENANFQKSDIVLRESILFEEIIESEDNRLTFISSHSNPLYQGPFSKPIGMRILKKSFSDFTSFKHSNIAVWVHPVLFVQITYNFANEKILVMIIYLR